MVVDTYEPFCMYLQMKMYCSQIQGWYLFRRIVNVVFENNDISWLDRTIKSGDIAYQDLILICKHNFHINYTLQKISWDHHKNIRHKIGHTLFCGQRYNNMENHKK